MARTLGLSLLSPWIAFLFTAFTSSAAETLSDAEITDLFSQSKELFRRANEVSAEDPEAAKDLYQKSALRLERIAREGGVHNGKLYYNIGNVYFRMNDIGRAILNYRRAERFIPNDENLHQNLAFARSRRTDKFEEGALQRQRVLHTLFFWHYDLTFATRSLVFRLTFALVWVAAGLRLFWPRPFLRWIAGIGAVLALMFGGSLVADSIRPQGERAGVIVAEEVVARKGDSQTYEPSFQDPLHAGTEFAVLERRTDWLHVKLADNAQTCWLPADAVELVW